MAIAVDLHLTIFGLVSGLSVVSLVVHLALRRGSALGWLAAALLCVAMEMLVLRYGARWALGVACVALLVPTIYYCAAQAVRHGVGLVPANARVTLGAVMLTSLSLVLMALPMPPTVQYAPFQLAAILVFLDATLALARKRKRHPLEDGLLALGFIVLAGIIVRVPMFPALVGEPTPWAPVDAAMFDRTFIQFMGLLTTGLALLIVARIVTRVIAGYRHSSERDGLTELLNRRAFDALIDKPTLSRGVIVMCDIDRFKGINDRFGHHAGDEVIRSFACLLSVHGDHAGRIGGEEFALLLLDVGLEEAAARAEAIRSAFDSLRHPAIGPAAQLSASFGVAAFEAGMPVRAAMRRADRALYAAKQSGRNRVAVAGDETALAESVLSAA